MSQLATLAGVKWRHFHSEILAQLLPPLSARAPG